MNRSIIPTHVTKVGIRLALRQDYQAILDIDIDAFHHPWDEEQLGTIVKRRDSICMVAVDDDRNEIVLGYIAYRLTKRSIYTWRLAVEPTLWRQGLGTQMIDKLKGKLSPTRRNRLVVDVEEANTRAHMFLRDQKFRAKILNRDVYRFVYRVGDRKV